MKNFSIALSLLFNPLVITSYLYWVLAMVYPEILWPYNSRQYLYLWCILSIGTLVMPTLSVIFLKFSRYVSDYDLTNRKERLLPSLFIVFWYGISSFLLISRLTVSWHLSIVLVATTLLIAVLTLISTWYKISIHSAGIWGAAGFMTAVMVRGHNAEVLFPLCLTFLIAGAVSSARLYLNLHTPNQVVFGAIVGFAISFGCLFVLW